MYGGTERVVACLADGLVKKGHDVTVFAAEGSEGLADIDTTFGKLIAGHPYEPENIEYCSRRIEYIAKTSSRFDILHNNDELLALQSRSLFKCPLVTTWHGPFDQLFFDENIGRDKLRECNFVSISFSQRKDLPDGNFVGNVYNGTTDLDDYTYGSGGDYLIWLGRFHQYKGAKEAIDAAKIANRKLILAGNIGSDAQQKYFDENIVNEIDDTQISYAGEVGLIKKVKLLQNAEALLMPIKWEEPFGLVMIEAMACGTPVIAFNRGSVPEIIADGKVGYIVKQDDVHAMADAVGRIERINRRDCREHVAGNFSIEKMVEGYEKVYNQIIRANKFMER